MRAGATAVRSRKEEVFKVFEQREKAEEPPFDDVLALFYHMKDLGSDIDDVGLAVAIGRLVREGRLRYALDGIRVIHR